MVFPSVPVYLDPPNWPQQQFNQEPGVATQNPQVPPLQQPPPSTVAVGGGGHQGSTRPGSMADRARVAKIQQPEATLKCPRCESTNTKFCYYNNYSLSQPRHFCKTCRRYWTRGGALRNVPVGGGCRRNKRSKGSSRSKSPIKADYRQATGLSSATANASSSCTTDVISHLPTPAPSQLLLPTSHLYSDYVSRGVGLHFGTIPLPATTKGNDADFQLGSSSGSGNNNGGSILSNALTEQWKLPSLHQVHQQYQQFPFLTNLEPPIGLYQFEGEQVEPPSYGEEGGQLRPKTLYSGASGIIPQPTTVKMEENQVLSLSKNLLDSSGNDPFWVGSGNAWNDIPSFTSSTSHFL